MKANTDKRGFSTIALIVGILLLGATGYILGSLMTRHQESVPRGLDSSRAFYCAQGGVEYTGKYLIGYTDFRTVPNVGSRALGSGNFTVAFSNATLNTIRATVTGTSGSATRQVIVDFGKTGTGGVSLLSLYAASSRGRVRFSGGSRTVPAGSYYQYASDSQMPRITVPNASDRTINSDTTLSAGTYTYRNFTITGSNTDVSVSGPVTVLCRNFYLYSGATFNTTASGHLPENLLVIASKIVYLDGADFEGAIYAPNARTTIDNSNINGAVAGGKRNKPVILSGGTVINFDNGAGSNCPLYNNTLGTNPISPGISDWRENY